MRRSRRIGRRVAEQLELRPKVPGRRRPGAGRPRKHAREDQYGYVRHRPRPIHKARHPLHVTLRAGRSWLRNGYVLAVLHDTLTHTIERNRLLQVIHFSLQRNHLHLIVESRDRDTLSRGMQGLASILARRINRIQGQQGALWAERYHARELRTPTEVRNAMKYVLDNHRHHRIATHCIDEYSSAAWLDREDAPDSPVRPGRTWLIRIGWHRL